VTIPQLIIVIALIFAVIEQIEARGKSLIIWSVILIGIALLWDWFNLAP